MTCFPVGLSGDGESFANSGKGSGGGEGRDGPPGQTNLSETIDFVNCDFQSSFVGAIAISDLIKTTLGPKGMVSFRIYN